MKCADGPNERSPGRLFFSGHRDKVSYSRRDLFPLPVNLSMSSGANQHWLIPNPFTPRTQAGSTSQKGNQMTNNHKARVLKVLLATLQQATQSSTNGQGPVASMLSAEQVASSLAIVHSVVNDDTSSSSPADTTTAADIAQLILQILQLILSKLPPSTVSAPAADDNTSAIDIGEIILEILELLLSKIPVSTGATPATDTTVSLSAVDIVQLILQVLQALLGRLQPTTSAVSKLGCADCAKKVGVLPIAAPNVIVPHLTTDSVTYTIDSLGRLTKLTYLNGTTITYNYDSVGNRTSVVTVCGGSGC
jgi:YD repeat-containing protein